MRIFKKTEEFVKENRIVEEGDKIIVAVSGGPDSVFLFYFLLYLSKKMPIQLRVVYIHHHLREEADEEIEFVKKISKENKVPFNFRNIKIEGKTGIEEKAREKRIKKLIEIAKKYKFNKIATGHTLDDHAETILMNLIRGCGFAGLRGILPVSEINNVFFIRPILCLEKEEIKKFLIEKNMEFKIDKTNISLKFFRNRVRHEIIPFLSKFNPEFKKNIAKMGFILQKDFEFLTEIVRETFINLTENNFFNVKKFKELHLSLKRYISFLLIEKFKKEFYRSYSEIERVRKKIESLNLEKIKIEKLERLIEGREEKKRNFIKEIEIPGETYILSKFKIKTEFVKFSKSIFKNKNPFIGYFDGKKVKKVIVRNRKKGDCFKPLGMKREKRLSKFLIRRKIPKEIRDEILIFESNGKIMWVGGVEISEDFKVSEKTEKILKIEIVFTK